MTTDYPFEAFVNDYILKVQLVRTNWVTVHSRYHADSEYVSYVEVDQGAQFISNKQTDKMETLNFIC